VLRVRSGLADSATWTGAKIRDTFGPVPWRSPWMRSPSRTWRQWW